MADIFDIKLAIEAESHIFGVRNLKIYSSILTILKKSKSDYNFSGLQNYIYEYEEFEIYS